MVDPSTNTPAGLTTAVKARLTYANVVSTLCLFLILGGGAYAALKLPKNSVSSKQIKRGAVKTQDIAKAAVAPRASVADRIPQLLVPNTEAAVPRHGRGIAAGMCGENSSGSLVKLEIGESCEISKPPFTLTARCSSQAPGSTRIDVTATSSEDGWIGYDQPRAAGEQMTIASHEASQPQSTLHVGPVLATPNGESLILGPVSVGVLSLAPCWTALYGVG